MIDTPSNQNENSNRSSVDIDPSFNELEKKHSTGLTFIYVLEHLSPHLRNKSELKKILEQSSNFSVENLAQLTHLLTEAAGAVHELEQKYASSPLDVNEPLPAALEIIADRLSKNDEFLRLALFGEALPASSVISSIQDPHDRAWLYENISVVREGIYNALGKLEEVVDVLKELKKTS